MDIYLDIEIDDKRRREKVVFDDNLLIKQVGILIEKGKRLVFFNRKSEVEILESLWEKLKDYSEQERWPLQIKGFNILIFDVPMLISRMMYHGITNIYKAYDFLYNKCMLLDLKQSVVTFRRFKWKGSFESICASMGIPVTTLSMIELWKTFDEEDWEKIETHQKSELLAQNEMFWHMRKA